MATGKYQRWLEPDGLTLLEDRARNGATDKDLARIMGVSLSTLYEWKRLYPKISEAIKKGKDVVDAQVENALLKRALGYEYTEKMIEESSDGYKTRKTIKFIPPDVTAQIFWLKNRRPDAWREKQLPADDKNLEKALAGARAILEGIDRADE